MSLDDHTSRYDKPSKSSRKRAAKAVEELAAEIASIPAAALAGLDLPEDIRAEMEEARRATSHGAKKRQIKHLAGILRKQEDVVAELQDYLAGSHQRQYDEKKRFHQLEALRDGLCDPARFDATLKTATEKFPGLDSEQLTQLACRVHTGSDRAAFREIFRLLKAAAPE